MCARNYEMALVRPCKAYSVFGTAHIINDLFSLCASNRCLQRRVPSPNYLRQSLCEPRECSQADSGSRRGPHWPSQNPVAGSTPAGKGACRCAPRVCAPAFSECTYTENLASYMCARNHEMAHRRPSKAYSVFGAAHIINDFFSICASNCCLLGLSIY